MAGTFDGRVLEQPLAVAQRRRMNLLFWSEHIVRTEMNDRILIFADDTQYRRVGASAGVE
jgi:hypothetical protein